MLVFDEFSSFWNRHLESHILLSKLNDVSYEWFGTRVAARLSMFNGHSHYPFLVLATLTYLALVHLGQALVARYDIKLHKSRWFNAYTLLHNVLMAVFSLYMLLDCAVKLYGEGALDSLPAYVRFTGSERTFNSAYDLFYWSKFLELIDTLILVARRKPILPVHLFHHATTASVSYAGRHQILWLGMWTNCLVHVLMYLHFARPINFLRQYLTTLQIVQFLFVMVTYAHWFARYSGLPWLEIAYPLGCYFVYLLYFLAFYYNNYVARPTTSKSAAAHGRTKKSQ